MPLAQLRTCAFNSRASFSSFGFFVSYLLREVLADEEQNQAEQCECLRHSSTDEEVAHELTLHLRLTGSRHAQAVGSNADTDARADGGWEKKKKNSRPTTLVGRERTYSFLSCPSLLKSGGGNPILSVEGGRNTIVMEEGGGLTTRGEPNDGVVRCTGGNVEAGRIGKTNADERNCQLRDNKKCGSKAGRHEVHRTRENKAVWIKQVVAMLKI